jgi:hypothetical protein
VGIVDEVYEGGRGKGDIGEGKGTDTATLRIHIYLIRIKQGFTIRCRLSWLANSALVYEPKCGGRWEGCGVSSNEYSCTQEPK